jgi:hypothetical protein
MVGGRPRGAAFVGIAVLAVALVSGCGGSQRAAAPVPQTIGAPARDVPGPTTTRGPATRIGAARRLHATPHQLFLTRARSAIFDVRKLKKTTVVRRERPEHEDPFGPPEDEGADMPSKLAQKQMVQKSAQVNTPTPSADSSFAGLGFQNQGHPPDENGDVGPTYYIQTVNVSIGIYNKSTGSLVASFPFNTFMSQGHFGNLCDSANFGDPVVLYDSYEDRWLITDFAFTLDGSGNVNPQTVYECFAVSKTGDPVNGGWNYYSILAPGGLADYPKFGIWPDGIYMSANMFGYSASGSYMGYHVWALNKQQMYAGAPQVSVVDFAGDTNDFTVIPVNSKLAAGAPPAGSPEYFVSTERYINALAIYKFHVNWDKVSTSTFTGPFSELAPNCWPNESPGNAATPANAADVLPLRAMAAPEYTNQGGVESLWVAHSVERGVSANNTCSPAAPTGGNATVRWYQANVTGGTIATNLTQGSSFDPDGTNTNFRYQPSLAVDHIGDMAMTYTESNATTDPKVMYDGRLAGDAANTLQTESTLIAGTGAQSGNCGTSACVRWGDYAGMELDPNGCEFWMTGEYYITTGLNDQTRIGSFHYPGCTPLGNGTLSGTVTDGTNPISGATITLGSRMTTTNGSGAYSFTVPAGTYSSLLADQPGYIEGSASSLVVPNGGTKTQNFTLSSAAQSGCVTDNSLATFQRGVPTNCDLTAVPGTVQLAAPDNTATQNSTVSPTGFGISNTAWGGQTFTPTVSGKLKRVDVELFCASCTATSPNVTLSIRATTGMTPVPTGADLATATLAGFNDGGAGGLKTFTLTTPLQVTAGTRYAFIFRLASVFSKGTVAYTCSCVTTGFTNTNPYANGQIVTSSNSGSTWTADTTAGGRDLNFVTYINPGFGSSGTFVSSMRDANPVPGSTVHWTTLTFADTMPANTSVKFQIAASNSQYGPWNYVGPDGTASTFFTTSGASLSQFNGFRYLRYEAFLSSSNPAVTPSISSVQTCFQDVAPPAPTTLNVSAATGAYGGTTTLSATLTSNANGVPNETVSFTLNGSGVGGATTNASGVATLNNVSLSGINVGSYPTGVAASFAGDSSFLTSSGSNSLTVSKANQTIQVTLAPPANAAVDDMFSVAATGGGSGNSVVYSSSGACTNTGANYTVTATGTCSVIFNQAGNGNYNAAPQITDLVNSSKANQTIHVSIHAPATAVYGTGFSVAATGGNSGNPIVYGSSGGCTNSGANFTMTSGTTSCTVTYDQAGSANYNAATQVTEVATATKANQAITVTIPAPATAAYNASFGVDANAPGGAVTFSSSGGCTNLVKTYTMTSGTVTCTVKFDRAGDTNYNAAPQVTESVTATKINQSITFATPPTHTYGDPDFDPGATSSSGLAVSYQASSACSIVGGIVHLTGAGSCTVKADQAGDADYNAAPQVQRTFTVNKANQAIQIGTNAPSSAGYGAGFTVAATGGGSGNPVTYGSSGVCTNTGPNFTMTSATGTCTVTYDQAGNANYNAATQVTQLVTAQKANQPIQITMNAPSSAVYGTGFAVAATGGGSGNPVVYGSSGACTNSGVNFTMTSGTGTCTVTYDQAGNGNYNAATQQAQHVTAAKAGQSISFAAPGAHTYGDANFAPGATASSGNVVSYGASGACSFVSGKVHLTGAGSCSVTADQAGDANYSAAPQVQRTFSVAKAALSITANNRQKYFDQALTLGTAAFTSSGLVGSDSVSGVTLTSSGAAASAASGSYPIMPSNALAGPSTSIANYTVSYHNGTLQVLPVGIIGLNGVKVSTSGGKIDSFKSSSGAYGSSNHGGAALVMSKGPLSFAGVALLGGAISTGSSVSVSSTASVSGNVTAGTTASILGTVGGTVTQHSPSTALSQPIVSMCPKFSGKTGISGGTFSYSATTGNLAVKGGTVKLASKAYCFNNVTLAAGSTLSVSGPVTIHLRAKLSGKGQIANTTNLPRNLHIDTSYTGSAGVAILGGNHAAMTIVAPKTSVTIAGGSYFGTVLAAAVNLAGKLSFHADMR